MALPTDKTVTFVAEFIDSKGRPAKFVAAPSITLDNPALAELEIGADGYSGKITPLGEVGTLTLTATGTRADGSVVVATGSIDIVTAEPVSGNIAFSEPV